MKTVFTRSVPRSVWTLLLRENVHQIVNNMLEIQTVVSGLIVRWSVRRSHSGESVPDNADSSQATLTAVLPPVRQSVQTGDGRSAAPGELLNVTGSQDVVRSILMLS